MFGTQKVVSGIDIKANSASIFQALRKCPIVTADIFLFNVGKSKNKFVQINFDALEKNASKSSHGLQQLSTRC